VRFTENPESYFQLTDENRQILLDYVSYDLDENICGVLVPHGKLVHLNGNYSSLADVYFAALIYFVDIELYVLPKRIV